MQNNFQSDTKFRNQFIFPDKSLRKSFEVYDTDSPAVEVWLLSFYFEH